MDPIAIIAILKDVYPLVQQLTNRMNQIKADDPDVWAQIVGDTKAADAAWDASVQQL